MDRQGTGKSGSAGRIEGNGVIQVVRPRKAPVGSVEYAVKGSGGGSGVLLRNVLAQLRPSLRQVATEFASECTAVFIAAVERAIDKSSAVHEARAQSAQSAYRVGKWRGGYVINCPSGNTVFLERCRGTLVLLMALANAGVTILYEFLVQAGETGPWKLLGDAGTTKWARSSSERGNSDETNPNDDAHVAYEDELHPAGGVTLDATDRKTLDDCEAHLATIRDQRAEAVLDRDQKTIADLDEREKLIRKYIRNVTDKNRKIRKQGWNRCCQRQLHACFERAIKRVKDQDEDLGAYLDQVVDRGAQFRFNGSSDEFVFDNGVLSSRKNTPKAGDTRPSPSSVTAA